MHKLDVSIISLSLQQGVSKIILLLLEDAQVYAQQSVVYCLGQDSTEVSLDLIKFRFYKHKNLHGNVLEEITSG